MLAEFDPDHQMRILRFETTPELDKCAELALAVETHPGVEREMTSAASYVISLARVSERVPEEGTTPPLVGHDADGFIKVLDFGVRHMEREADRMYAGSVLRLIESQGIDLDDVLAA